jgi:L-seryl-tRNA(Ser) seleniumtransferase
VVEKYMNEKQKLLSQLPSVDEILKSEQGTAWLNTHPRRFVLQAIREALDARRRDILRVFHRIFPERHERARNRMRYRKALFLQSDSGYQCHRDCDPYNLGRSLLSDRALENIIRVSASYSEP